MASEPRKVSQVITPLTVDFETGDLVLEFHELERVVMNFKDVCCFEPYHMGQRFRVTIEEVPDGE